MPEEKRTIILYKAEWCGHCVQFNKNWKIIKERIDDIRKNNKMVSYEEYDADKDPEKIEEAGIEGFPTIQIKIGDKVAEYGGSRDDVDNIMDTLLKSNPDQQAATDQDAQKYGQCGGKRKNKKSKRLSQNDYKIKYIKYKAKYFKLLSNMKF